MRKILLIETASAINGGQKMSLLVSDILRDTGEYEITWLIPEEGALSESLKEKGYTYFFMGNVDLPASVKKKSTVFKYARISLSAINTINKLIAKENIDIIYAPGPAALPWSAICGTIKHRPVIWHLHHMFLDGPTLKLLNFTSACGCVKSIVAVSNAVGSQISNSKGKTKINVLYNPVDFEKYSNGNADRIKNEYPFNILRRGNN